MKQIPGQMSAIYFSEKENGTWVEDGCDVCRKGMTGRIYRFQREHRPQGTMCMTCSKKQHKRDFNKYNKQ